MFRKGKFIDLTESRSIPDWCLEGGMEIDNKWSHDNLGLEVFKNILKLIVVMVAKIIHLLKRKTLNFVYKVKSEGEAGTRPSQTL